MALHFPSAGVGAALGALNVAFRDSDAPYLQRARHMLLTSVLMGIAVFAGSVSGRYPALSVIVAGGWALVAGMVIALSLSASEIGVLSLLSQADRRRLALLAVRPLPARLRRATWNAELEILNAVLSHCSTTVGLKSRCGG